MPAASATPEQIKSYEETVARAWGGRDKLGTLFASSPDYHLAFIDAVYGRYQGALDLLVPWVRRLVPDIAVRRLFEVGCGTGSSTAAFATICEQVTAFDVAERDVVLARERLTHFAAIGSTADACDFPEILRRLDSEDRVDGVLLFAVLEHMYVSERIDVLRRAWAKLPPGGIIVICETPNRLSYFDRHTFRQPFMNMLPPELVKLWAATCTNQATRDQIEAIRSEDYLELRDKFVRMGQSGPSFHEFETAIGTNVHRCVISGEFDPEISPINGPYRLEHDLLSRALRERTPHVHPAFAMPMLYVILRKPDRSHVPIV
jgi:2-polyprenyl-3-methyl-5-hydroxy-6-metoxy-1,4-benzoquinol methylase